MTLVVQDWGGPLGLRFAVEQPERVARLVVLNTGIGARAPTEEWLRFQAFMRRVGTDIVAGQLVRLSLVQPTSDDVIAAYDAPFPVPESRVGIVAVPGARRDERGPSVRADDARGAREAARAWNGRARALRRQRSDLLATRRRGDGELLPGAELDRRSRAPATSCRRTAARRSAPDRRLAPLT